MIASDVWVSDIPGVRPRHAPDRRDALELVVELRDVGAWMAIRNYSRVGSRIFIDGSIPVLEAVTPGGRFASWWTPTPVVENN
jgi:hypothetical protein